MSSLLKPRGSLLAAAGNESLNLLKTLPSVLSGAADSDILGIGKTTFDGQHSTDGMLSLDVGLSSAPVFFLFVSCFIHTVLASNSRNSIHSCQTFS
jgi:hypothetical protein